MDAPTLLANVTATRTYLTFAVNGENRLLLSFALGIVCLLGITMNSLVIHISRAETRSEEPDHERQRRALINYFMYNLAVSDLCTCLVSAPSLITQTYTQNQGGDVQCRLYRSLGFIFPACTNFLILVMSAERYFTLANPFNFMTVSTSRILIKLAWVFGVFWAAVLGACYKANVVILDAASFSTDCVYDREDPTRRGLVLTGMIIVFILPGVVILFTTIRSVSVIRNKATTTSPGDPRGDLTHPTARAYIESKVRSTYMLILVVVAFAASYVPYVIYSLVKLIAGAEYTSYSNDSAIRYSAGIACYTTSVVNPIIYVSLMQSLRTKLKALFGCDRNAMGGSAVHPSDPSGEMTYNPETANQVRALAHAQMPSTSGIFFSNLKSNEEVVYHPDTVSLDSLPRSVQENITPNELILDVACLEGGRGRILLQSGEKDG